MATVVDVHTHVVPGVIRERRGSGTQWPSIVKDATGDEASVVIGGRVFRRIDSRCWDVSRRLADMRDDHVDFQVLSPMPELLSHWLAPDDAEALAEIVNTDIARMIVERPDRFSGIGMVCMQDRDRALRQLQTLKAQGLRGIEIGSHINGVPLGHETLFPIFEAAQDLGLCVFVHPLHPAGMERIGSAPDFGAIAAFPLETALAAVSLLAHGVLEKLPKLRILLSHGGGALPWILPRIDHGWSLGGNAQKLIKHKPSEIARRFWYDTIVYDEEALRLMASKLGHEHIVVGSDYPFSIRQLLPGDFASRSLGIDSPSGHANAESFLDIAVDARPIAEEAR